MWEKSKKETPRAGGQGIGSGLLPGHPNSLGLPLGWVGMVPTLTWSPMHSRSQVLWASTHKLGLSWLGHTPEWLLGPCSRLAPEVSPTMRSSGRSSLWADMGTTGPEGGGVWLPALQALLCPDPFRHPPFQACGQHPDLGPLTGSLGSSLAPKV